MAAAVKAAKSLKKGQRCVVMLPDSVRNYMTKFLNDGWMVEKKFMDEPMRDSIDQHIWWSNVPVASLAPTFPITVEPDVSCGDVIKILRKEGFDQIPVVSSTRCVRHRFCLAAAAAACRWEVNLLHVSTFPRGCALIRCVAQRNHRNGHRG